MGRVKSLARPIYNHDGSFSRFKSETIKTPVYTTDKYLSVKLCVDGINKTCGIHRLVAEAFISNPDNLPEVNHIDTDRTNNYVENLEWVTHQDNVTHSVKLGHYKGKSGENNPNFGNHILHDIYSNNKELAKEKLSRPGKQNGRSRNVVLYDLQHVFYKSFDYIKECAEWYKQTYEINLALSTIHQRLIGADKLQIPYYEYFVSIK